MCLADDLLTIRHPQDDPLRYCEQLAVRYRPVPPDADGSSIGQSYVLSVSCFLQGELEHAVEREVAAYHRDGRSHPSDNAGPDDVPLIRCAIIAAGPVCATFIVSIPCSYDAAKSVLVTRLGFPLSTAQLKSILQARKRVRPACLTHSMESLSSRWRIWTTLACVT
jgi:hypothetical protein